MSTIEDIKRLAWLKNALLTANEIEVANATYSRGYVGFGDLQDLGAGSIVRIYDLRGDLEYYAFFYKEYLYGEPLRARLKIGMKFLNPGDHIESKY